MRFLLPVLGLLSMTLLADPHEDRHGDHHRDRRESRHEERHQGWREGRSERRHEEDRREARHPEGHRPAPRWLRPHWGPSDRHRYVAVIPGDPHHIYVLRNGGWVYRPIREDQFRMDLELALGQPAPPPPPIPPPRTTVGVQLKFLLFQ